MVDKKEQETIGLMVHSYNNFLAGMMGFTELTLLDVENDDVRERLELVLSSGKEAVTFGKQLLSLTSRLQVALKPVSILNILEEVATANNVALGGEKIEGAVKVNSDVQWLWYCLESLCQFCTKISDGTSLAFHIKRNEQQLVIQISGESLSFDDEQVDRLFEPFYTSRHLLGSKDVGIGFIRGFVLQMKGEMKWDNKKGFVILLPLAT